MTQVKVFNAKITDEYGGDYPQAVVAIRAVSKSSQETWTSENCEGAYSEDIELDAITYKVNYWYTPQTKAQGKRSRPLLQECEDGFTDVFEVDLDNAEVNNYLEASLVAEERILRAIQSDVVAKFR